MANEKKSVILYCDLIHTIEKMDDETAGKFFKHYLRYINDLNPETDNLIVDISFESIKQNLKRDLRMWESSKESKRDNGKIGNLKRWNKDVYDDYKSGKIDLENALVIAKGRKVSPSDKIIANNRTSDNFIANVAVTVNDNVNVNVNDNVNDINKQKEKEKEPVFSFRKELLNLGGDEQLVSDWMMVRKKLKAIDTKTALDRFLNQVKLSGKDLNFVLAWVVFKSYKGFEADWLIPTNAAGVKIKSNNKQKIVF